MLFSAFFYIAGNQYQQESKRGETFCLQESNKSAPIDFNDVPLSTLIEQNSDAIDVNLSHETISITMLIGVILILGLFLEIPLIIMAIPMVILLTIIIGTPLILREIIKNLSMLKRLSILR